MHCSFNDGAIYFKPINLTNTSKDLSTASNRYSLSSITRYCLLPDELPGKTDFQSILLPSGDSYVRWLSREKETRRGSTECSGVVRPETMFRIGKRKVEVDEDKGDGRNRERKAGKEER